MATLPIGAEANSRPCFYLKGKLSCLSEPAPSALEAPRRAAKTLELKHQTARALQLMKSLVRGPSREARSKGFTTPYPKGSSVESVQVKGPIVEVRLDLPGPFLKALDPLTVEAIVRQAIASGQDLLPKVRGYRLMARDLETGRLKPLVDFLPRVAAVPPKKAELKGCTHRLPLVKRLVPWESTRSASSGFLSGKTVYLSAGHGWYWHSSLGWICQRGNTHGIVEDFSNPEAVNAFLVPYLRNAGATVFTLRETDRNSARVVVDNEDGTTHPGRGTYEEQGDSQNFADSTLDGYLGGRDRFQSGENPFSFGGNRLLTTSATATSWSRWTPTLPYSGRFAVYVSYSQYTARASDAHYVVNHAGGSAHFQVDQKRHGMTWIYLGTFYFNHGHDPDHASVILYNDSAEGGTNVSADAVRFGGGMANISRNDTTHPRPLWEMAARYYTQYNGAPTSVYDSLNADNSDDVACRSRYAAWQNEAGEDAVYFSWHTNAPNPARGTSSYVYGPNQPDGTYNFTGTAGSDTFISLIHSEVIQDIRTLWDADWRDRGIYTAWFGEINPNYNNEMPAALIEVAFHDTEADADVLKEPRFRNLVSRAVYKGIAKYFADRDGVTVKLLPEPPRQLSVFNDGMGKLRLRWQPGPAGGSYGDLAQQYIVYTSLDGKAFDQGTLASDLTFQIEGLDAGAVRYFKVSALNEGGESFPGETVGARVSTTGRARILVVNGYDRMDRWQRLNEDLSAYSLGTVWRIYPEMLNSYDYIVRHGESISAFGASFDSASNEAVLAGDLLLTSYEVVDWISGEETDIDQTFSPQEQTLVQVFAANGGALLSSGSEIGWHLDFKGTAADKWFLENVLRVRYVADDAETYSVTPVPGGIFDGLPNFSFDDGTHGTYDVEWPEVFAVQTGEAALTYTGSSNVAAVAASGPTYRSLTLGIPLETIYPENLRHQVFARALTHLGLTPDPEAPDGGIIDGGLQDGGIIDGGLQDGGIIDGGTECTCKTQGGCGCNQSGDPAAPVTLLILLLLTLLLLARKGPKKNQFS